MIEQGLICPTWQFRDRKEGVVATFELSRLKGDTDHPYRVQCEQWRLGEMLFAQLKAHPLATIRFGTSAIAARQTGDGVEVDLSLAWRCQRDNLRLVCCRRRRHRQRRAQGHGRRL